MGDARLRGDPGVRRGDRLYGRQGRVGLGGGRRNGMWARVLGSAAGGGFPQWNCTCPPCRAVRDRSRPCRPRTQSSIAVSPDYRRWFLLNASPDIHAQIESCPALHPSRGPGGERKVPVQAILLTDAELDHTLGLLLLRE